MPKLNQTVKNIYIYKYSYYIKYYTEIMTIDYNLRLHNNYTTLI